MKIHINYIFLIIMLAISNLVHEKTIAIEPNVEVYLLNDTNIELEITAENLSVKLKPNDFKYIRYSTTETYSKDFFKEKQFLPFEIALSTKIYTPLYVNKVKLIEIPNYRSFNTFLGSFVIYRGCASDYIYAIPIASDNILKLDRINYKFIAAQPEVVK